MKRIQNYDSNVIIIVVFVIIIIINSLIKQR